MTSSTDDIETRALALFEAALEQDAALRETWINEQAKSDSELRDRALSLLRQDQVSGSAMHTGRAILDTLDDTAMPEQIGAYKVIKLIGQGGMGAVYLGKRIHDDFDHLAAIKVIRHGVLSDKLIARFELERQTLAKLSHPFIARLFDGGTTDDGAPYMIMEHVDGAPITDWADKEQLSKRRRLNLFSDVCKAVQYLHQNLIVHRDITPSNVLLTKAGDVKLIDFGIAKPYDDEGIEHMPGHSLPSLSFTPGYAAPERTKGVATNTLADIFSLGRLLKELLKECKPDLELQAVIKKATALNPQDRYNSVNMLIEDIDHCLNDLPVKAFSHSSAYRFKKFFARHKVGSILASAATTMLVITFVATVFQYQRAEIARAQADKRFNDVRRLATTMIGDIHAEIYRVPGSAKATKKLVEAAQTYLDELASDPNAPTDVKREAAIGYTKLGKTMAGTKGGSISDLDASDKFFARSKEIFDDLDRLEQADVLTLTAMGQLFFYIAEVNILPRQELDLAWEQLQTSLAYLERAIDIEPNNLNVHIAWMHSNCISAEILIEKNKPTKAQKMLRDCVAKGADLLEKHPKNEEILRIRSAAGRTLANALAVEEKFADAIPVLDEAIKDLAKIEPLLDSDNDSFMLRARTIAYWRRGYAYTNIENYESAVKDYATALEFTDKRLKKDPKDKDAIWFYHTIIAERATPLQKLGRIQEAEAGLLTTLKWYNARLLEKPKSATRQNGLFIHHYMMGDFYGKINETAKECESYSNAYGFASRLKKAGKFPPLYEEALSNLKAAAVHCKLKY